MNVIKPSRREFLKSSGAVVTGAAGFLTASGSPAASRETNPEPSAPAVVGKPVEPSDLYEFILPTDVSFPPALPYGMTITSDTSEEFLRPIDALREGVTIAETPPSVDFMYYPGQETRGLRWSNWGGGCFADGKYYSAIGDHAGLGQPEHRAGSGESFVYEFDPDTRVLKQIADVSKLLDVPEGHYTPGKIHSRVDMGHDGCLYFSTLPGIIPAVQPEFHYGGDSIFRHDTRTGETTIVARNPIPGHGLPTSIIDPERLIYYAGGWIMTERGEARETGESTKFLAYDLVNRETLYLGDYGPDRYIFFVESTQQAYYVAGRGNFMTGPLWRFDPDVGKPVRLDVELGLRAATAETPQGIVYTVSNGQLNDDPPLWAFDTRTESVENLGSFAVGQVTYVASLVADSTGRYLYYMPGAHGDARDGTAVVQYDTRTRTRKVIAFLHPYYWKKFGSAPIGTFSLALNDEDDTLYITANTKRSAIAEWDCCALIALRIPDSERLT